MDIGRALSGLGAAFKNEVPEFRQRIRQEDLDAEKRAQREMLMADRVFDRGLAAEDRAMRLSDREENRASARASKLSDIDDKRQKTLFIDSEMALGYLNDGDLQSVLQKFTDRREVLPSMGVTDLRLTDDVLGLISSAYESPQGLNNLRRKLEGYVDTGRAYNILSKPETNSYTLSSGQTRYEDGQPVATGESEPKPLSQREQKILDLSDQLEANGTPNFRNVAINIVDGNISVDFSEDGSSATLTDLTKLATNPRGAVTNIEIARRERPPEQPPVGGTLFDLITQDEDLGGPSGAAKQAVREVANMVGLDPYAEETQGIQRLKAAGMDLIGSLREGGRYIQGETDMIKEEIGNLSPSFFTSDVEIANKMKSLSTTLRGRLNTARTNASDTTLVQEERSSQTLLANNLEDFLRLMGATEGGVSSAVTIPDGPDGDAMYAELPSGAKYNSPTDPRPLTKP